MATFYFTNPDYRLVRMTSRPQLIRISEGLLYPPIRRQPIPTTSLQFGIHPVIYAVWATDSVVKWTTGKQ